MSIGKLVLDIGGMDKEPVDRGLTVRKLNSGRLHLNVGQNDLLAGITLTDAEVKSLVDALTKKDEPAVAIPVKLVVLTRAEGPTDECVRKQFDSIADAEAQLYRWARTAPERGDGYNKVDFKVCWEDGEEYEGRYDMNRQGEDDVIGHDLRHHIVSFVAFGAHKATCPGYFKGKPVEEKADEYNAWLDKYLPDAKRPAKWWCCDRKEAK